MQISLVSTALFWNVSHFYGCLKDRCVLKVCIESITTFSRRILEFMQISNFPNIVVTAYYCMRFNLCAYVEKMLQHGKLKKCVFATYHAIHICKLARGWIYCVPFHAKRSRLSVDHITNNANFSGFTSRRKWIPSTNNPLFLLDRTNCQIVIAFWISFFSLLSEITT